MKLNELKIRLRSSNVPERWYSLNEGLKPDACILYKNYHFWEFFYLDEKGNRNDYRTFKMEDEACEFLLKKMEYQLRVFGLSPKK